MVRSISNCMWMCSFLVSRQDYVRKLKSNFLELETKVRFLDAIAGSTDRQSIHVSDEMFAETEISVAHAKNKLKKSKASCAVERSQLEDTITEVAQCYEDYESTSRISRAKLHALATLVEAQKAQKAADAFLYTEDASQMEEVSGIFFYATGLRKHPIDIFLTNSVIVVVLPLSLSSFFLFLFHSSMDTSRE